MGRGKAVNPHDEVHFEGRSVLQLVPDENAGVADEHIHRVALLLCPVVELLAGFAAGEVGVIWNRLHPEIPFNLGGDPPVVFVTVADYKHIMAFCGQLAGILQAHSR